MRLSAQNNQFVFSLPQSFITPEVMKDFQTLLDKDFVQYDNVLDYINSTIKEITLPGITYELTQQNIIRGKAIYYKSAKNVHDTFGSEITITFKAVDSWMNYFIIQRILTHHYLDVSNPSHIDPFIFAIVDRHRDGIFRVKFDRIVMKGMSEIRLNYSDMLTEEQTFTITFVYNFFDLEYIPTGKTLLNTDNF